MQNIKHGVIEERELNTEKYINSVYKYIVEYRVQLII